MTIMGKRVGPLPEGHPLKGSHIYFVPKQPNTSEKNLKNDSSKNEKTVESNASADQPQQSPTPSSTSTSLPNTQPKTPSGNFENRIYIRKAPGMSLEEFKKSCVEVFRKAGMLTEDKPPEFKDARELLLKEHQEEPPNEELDEKLEAFLNGPPTNDHRDYDRAVYGKEFPKKD